MHAIFLCFRKKASQTSGNIKLLMVRERLKVMMAGEDLYHVPAEGGAVLSHLTSGQSPMDMYYRKMKNRRIV